MGVLGKVGAGVVLASLLSQAAQAGDAAATLVDTLRCDVLAALAVSALPTTRVPSNAFVILAPRDRPQAYVQCLMTSGLPRVICELSSGRLGPPTGSPGALRHTPEKEQVIARLGFELSGTGNHRRLFDEMPPGGVGAIADLMLTAQALVFDTTLDSGLLITAPRAYWRSRPVAACPLLSERHSAAAPRG